MSFVQKWIAYLALILTFMVGLTSHAKAQDGFEALCSSLNRPNIDCSCVAKRVSTFEQYAPTLEAKQMISEGYKRALGLNNDFENAITTAYGDQDDFMRRVAIQEAFDPLGGEPNSAKDFETGCVIAGKAVADLTPSREISLSADYSTKAYYNNCIASVGDTQRYQRFCTCSLERITRRISDQEFEAYFRSFTQYEANDGSQEELRQRRADSMGLSPARYQELATSARSKIESNSERDEAFCDSRNWSVTDLGQTEEERTLAGFDPDVLNRPVSALSDAEASTRGSTIENARKIVSDNCAADGNSSDYCGCYINDFEAQVVSRAKTPAVALAWALLNGSGALSDSQYISTMQSIPEADMRSAAMMNLETMDLGGQCSKGQTSTAPALTGTAEERMIKICMSENDNRQLCECTTSKMKSKLSVTDFKLIVDIREADHQGADDPLAKVAADRGMTTKQAEQAMMTNQSLMGGMMGMDLMSCMGGMPNLSNIPGMPDISQFPGFGED